MSRYESADFERESGSAGFEDPRFAGGRRPDDDNDQAFGGSFSSGSSRGGSRIGCGCVLTVLTLGAAFLVICCGGVGWFTLNDQGERVAAELSGDPELRAQLEEVLGPGYRLEHDVSKTLEAPERTVVFDAYGPRGSGTLTVVTEPARDFDPNAGPGATRILSGTLTLSDGTTRELVVPATEEFPEEVFEEFGDGSERPFDLETFEELNDAP